MPRKDDEAYKTEKAVFAQRLTEIMKERGENQTTLAAKISAQLGTIQRQTISLYMNGQSKPDTERLTALAKVLNVSADWLLGLADDPVFDADERAIVEATGLSGLAVATLMQSKSEKKLADILSILIEEEFIYMCLYGDAYKRYPNSTFKLSLKNAEKEMKEMWCDQEDLEYRVFTEFAEKHCRTILSHLYDYLIGWKGAWTDGGSKNVYITEDGEIKEDRGKGVPFRQDEMLEYAYLYRIQDDIRSLKNRRAMESEESGE